MTKAIPPEEEGLPKHTVSDDMLSVDVASTALGRGLLNQW